MYVVEHGKEASATPASGAAFDAKAFVETNWATKVLPAIESAAQDAEPVLAAIAADPAAAGAASGRQAGTGSPFTYTVRGRGVVVDVDREAVVGTMSVDLEPTDGKADLAIAIGPAFVGTAVRDALPFVDFSQFTNQLDYADVSTALNARVKSDVIGKIDIATVKGKTVSFVGAFADIDHKNAVITPVMLTVAS